MNENSEEEKPLPYKKHSKRQWFYFEEEPIGYWVKLQFHQLNCQCKQKSSRYNICPKLYSCTCYNYAYLRNICEHVKQVHRSFYPIKVSEILLREELEVNAITMSDVVEMMSICENDQFPYERCFSNESKMIKHSKYWNLTRYWHGYETMLQRHELGLTYRDDEVVMLSENSWKITRVISDKMGLMEEVNEVNLKITISKENIMNRTVVFPNYCEICSPQFQCIACHFCRHTFKCTCSEYNLGFLCQHCHAIAIMVSNCRQNSYKLSNDFRYYRNFSKRNIILNTHNRVRHNAAVSMGVLVPNFQTYIVFDFMEVPRIQLFWVRYTGIMECEVCLPCDFCPVCFLCRHWFVCPCPDYERGFICSHLHAAKLNFIGQSFPDLYDSMSESDDDERTNVDKINAVLKSCSNANSRSCSRIKSVKNNWSSRYRKRIRSNKEFVLSWYRSTKEFAYKNVYLVVQNMTEIASNLKEGNLVEEGDSDESKMFWEKFTQWTCTSNDDICVKELDAPSGSKNFSKLDTLFSIYRMPITDLEFEEHKGEKPMVTELCCDDRSPENQPHVGNCGCWKNNEGGDTSAGN